MDAQILLNKVIGSDLPQQTIQENSKNIPAFFVDYIQQQKDLTDYYQSRYQKLDPHLQTFSYVLQTNPEKIISQLIQELP